MWPIPSEKSELYYKFKAASSGISYIAVQETYEEMVLITEDSIVVNLQFTQMI